MNNWKKYLEMVKGLIHKKVVKNAGWIMTGRIVHMICAFFVSLLTARYLGPSNFGLINYATAYTNFFYAICTLGINSVLVKVLIDDPKMEGESIGTSMMLQFLSSVFSALVIIGIVRVIDGNEPVTILVTALCTVGMIARVPEVLYCWFQAHLLSKYTAIASTVAYVMMSLYRVLLLILGASVQWFALATAVDCIVVSLFLLVFYFRLGGKKFSLSKKRAKQLLTMSTPFILSGLMVSIYSSTDKLMLKQMLSEESVGYYSTAISLCNVWVFVLSAIIESLYPIIMEAHNNNQEKYGQLNRLLYAIVFYTASFVSILFVLFGKPAIYLLYGEAYLPAYKPLRIITWYVAFSYLGVARNPWVVSENRQKYITPIYAGSALTNVLMNLLLIPRWGASGAAMASLITQFSTIFVFPFLIKPMRENAMMMVDAVRLKIK